jgi:hypothetical protein
MPHYSPVCTDVLLGALRIFLSQNATGVNGTTPTGTNGTAVGNQTLGGNATTNATALQRWGCVFFCFFALRQKESKEDAVFAWRERRESSSSS